MRDKKTNLTLAARLETATNRTDSQEGRGREG